MRQPVLVDDEDSLYCPTHAHLIELFTHPLEPGSHRAVFLIQRLLGAESVVSERIPESRRTKTGFTWSLEKTALQASHL